MADHHDVSQVEMIGARDYAQKVHRAANVLKRPRITAAAMTEPAIFYVPDGIASVPQRLGDAVHELEARERGLPATAMDYDHDARAATPRRHPKLAVL